MHDQVGVNSGQRNVIGFACGLLLDPVLTSPYARMKEEPHAEEHIWKPIAKSPALVGYPGAQAVNQVQLGSQSGYIDLVLIPTRGQTKLVLLEAKGVKDRRSSADVIGQLLEYYAHALDMTADSVDALVNATRSNRLLSFNMTPPH